MKIAIVGVGLIGGSLALCFKDKPNIQVVGYSKNPASVEKYIKRGVVDHATTSIREAAEDADIIFLCVPVGMLESYLEQLIELPLKKGCIITDVGSTKGSIERCAKRLGLKDVYFIGGHPMAGSERSGVEAASSYLFENAFYVLTPNEQVPDDVYARLEQLLSYTRARIIRVDAELHDEIVGAISHLPHIIAVALVNQIARYNDTNPLYQDLAAGGFRDLTRIASSDPVIWRDILLHNREVLLRLLSDWQAEIDHFRQLIISEDAAGIERQFAEATEFRSRLPERRKGVLHAMLYDLYVDVPDTPGIIARITTILSEHQINLSNIQIHESRADVPGVMRLSFRNDQDLDTAKQLLAAEGYTVRV
jgi:prephenate dehydrogenase